MIISAILIGIIGLSPGAWAANAHLPYLQHADSKFKIVAICNFSVDNAAKSAKDLGLGKEVRVYGDVQDIANDEDVDLVVCTTRVDRHYASIMPPLKAGKNVFVEWPLGKNLEEARELLEVSKQNKVKLTAVGLQGHFDASVETLKRVLAEGRIGKVLSTTIFGQGVIGGQTELETQTYLSDCKTGASLLTIPASHLLDTVREVLGELSSVESLISNQRPVIKVVSADGTVVKENFEKTSPDHVMIQGTLESGAVLSATIRGGAPFKEVLRLSGISMARRGRLGSGVETIELEKGSFAKMAPINRNVARVYDAIAAGDKTILCDFENAVKRHEFIDDTHK
ncbi:NAD-binding Rossmann fold oxidoreductase family protein [Sclerotinia borealis F-4128]|uniref:NAD-binding Rossmann fold oxidoreductase family protein n=1 Tax=Sclerotinia borealis (strain F-4128) TaxID=1432307 RepID=W9C8Q2_SCLBF|nr:NAD-binding Rossmann fold oxidoreductase family protein [Sclerotinia borealis F-4128]